MHLLLKFQNEIFQLRIWQRQFSIDKVNNPDQTGPRGTGPRGAV